MCANNLVTINIVLLVVIIKIIIVIPYHQNHPQVRQLKFDQPGLEATLLKPTNECGVEKLVCTFVKVLRKSTVLGRFVD